MLADSTSRFVADLQLQLSDSTLCCTSAATVLASVDTASADHNPARFCDSSISSAISRQHKYIRTNSNDAHSIYSICSHDKASATSIIAMVRLQVLLLPQHLSLQKLRHLLYLPLKHFSPSIYCGSPVLLLLQERCSACCLYQGRESSCHYKWNNNIDLSDASTAVIALLQPVAVPASYCLCSVDLQRC